MTKVLDSFHTEMAKAVANCFQAKIRLPPEIIAKILEHVAADGDLPTLLSQCQRVSKGWKGLIETLFWRRVVCMRSEGCSISKLRLAVNGCSGPRNARDPTLQLRKKACGGSCSLPDLAHRLKSQLQCLHIDWADCHNDLFSSTEFENLEAIDIDHFPFDRCSLANVVHSCRNSLETLSVKIEGGPSPFAAKNLEEELRGCKFLREFNYHFKWCNQLPNVSELKLSRLTLFCTSDLPNTALVSAFYSGGIFASLRSLAVHVSWLAEFLYNHNMPVNFEFASLEQLTVLWCPMPFPAPQDTSIPFKNMPRLKKLCYTFPVSRVLQKVTDFCLFAEEQHCGGQPKLPFTLCLSGWGMDPNDRDEWPEGGTLSDGPSPPSPPCRHAVCPSKSSVRFCTDSAEVICQWS